MESIAMKKSDELGKAILYQELLQNKHQNKAGEVYFLALINVAPLLSASLPQTGIAHPLYRLWNTTNMVIH